MLKIITSLVLFLIGIAAQAQSENDLASVTTIKVKNGVELIYTQNKTSMLRIETQNPRDLQQVITAVNGKTLTITGRDSNVLTKVHVSTPEIETFKASSGAKITLAMPLETQNLQIILNSGAQFSGLTRTKSMKLYANYGTIYNGRTETGSFSGNFSNAQINLSGIAVSATIKASESTSVNAKNFIAANSKVNITENASIVIYGKEKLRLITDESAKVTYYGCPQNLEVNNRYVASK